MTEMSKIEKALASFIDVSTKNTTEHERRFSSIELNLEQTSNNVDKVINRMDALIESNGEQKMNKSSLERIVSSFQRFAEATFSQLPNAAEFSLRRNVFQNLGESSTLWREACGKGYEDMLSPKELEALHRLFQQRHLLAHKEGFVDEEYLSNTDDRTYSVGQRLVLSETSVVSLANLVTELATQLKQL